MEPGWIHRKIATTILKVIQAKSEEKLGTPLSVGELPIPDPDSGVVAGDETREPVELLARVIAHVAHRIPGLKRIEKRFEGKDNRSGLGSDLLALGSQLISRNETVVYSAVEGVAGEAMKGIIKKDNPAQPPTPMPVVPAHWEDTDSRASGVDAAEPQ